ncbi:hypothetical protein P2H44_18355 [Albimonas sp. CAU 1670]|uniref:hypothetical protein n=1 Tax=Albimonas sp. CAU 1670 TaxID=3032599 RepID=UPI0023DA858C|nr:hypothetical protein [Albimonas sp. CAU 1670]MDF2234527.1 hypothetical protein [Albimonas sp. CAU 1670]
MSRISAAAARPARRLARLALLAAAIPLLAACAGRSAQPLAGEAVTNEYRLGGIYFDNERGDQSIYFVVARLREDDGMTAVCGAYGITGAEDFSIFGVDRLPAVLDRSRVQFDGETFLWDAARFTGPHSVAEIEDIVGKPAACLRLDRPWRPEYGDRERLEVDMPDRLYFTG